MFGGPLETARGTSTRKEEALSAEDLLEPQVPPEMPVRDEDRTDDLGADRDPDEHAREEDQPGIEGEEHLGLTPPD